MLFGRLPEGVQAAAPRARGDAAARVRAYAFVLYASGIAFDLHAGGASLPVRSPLLGRFNVANLLAVAAELSFQGLEPQAIAGVLSRLQPLPGLMNRLGRYGVLPLVVLDFYQHTATP